MVDCEDCPQDGLCVARIDPGIEMAVHVTMIVVQVRRMVHVEALLACMQAR